MKKHIFLLFSSLIFSTSGLWSQKIDIDKKSVTTSLIRLPEKDVDPSFKTFSYVFNGENFPAQWGMDRDEIKARYFKLEGYSPVEKDGDLHLEFTLKQVRFMDSNVESRTEKSKDKAGRETSTTYYKHVLTYETGYQWKVTDKNGNDLTKKFLSLQATNLKKHAGSEFRTYKEASESYHNNRVQIQRDLAVSEITSAMNYVYNEMNDQFGFRPIQERFNLWVVDNKNHPETEPSVKHAENLKAIFEALPSYGLSEADMEAVRPAIEYYLGLPEKYKADEKADKKLRYAAWFNLSNIYLHLDQPDKAIEYANKLIENDYDKGDGKDFIKEATKLKELFAKKGASSRRFNRLSANN